MTGAEPQPDAAPPPPDPAGPGSTNLPIGEVALSHASVPAGPNWPIALAVWALAYAAYELAEFILNLLPRPKLWIGLLTGSATVGGSGQMGSLTRMGFALGALTPLLAVLLLLCGAAIFLRRRWSLWAMGAWALLDLLQLLAMIVLSVMQLRSMPLPYMAWALVSSVPYHLLLPVAVLLFLCRGKTRGQFRLWADGGLPVLQPVWPVVVGWLSMFIAVGGLNMLIRDLGLAGVSYCLFENMYGRVDADPQWHVWRVALVVAKDLPFLAMMGLAFPAMALLKRRPNAARLHVIGACLVLGSLLVAPIVAVIGGISNSQMMTQDSIIVVYGMMFIRSAYPIFLLFWFLRPAIRSQVAHWRRPGEPAMIPGESNAATSERGPI